MASSHTYMGQIQTGLRLRFAPCVICECILRSSASRPGPADFTDPWLARMKCQTRWAQALLLLPCIMMILFETVEGAQKTEPRRRRIKKSRAGVGKDFSEFLLVIGAIMTCVIAPVFAFFLHSIYKDPAAPELARACWKAIKEKLLSYLGGQQPAMPDSSVNRNNTSGSSSVLGASRRRKIDTIDNRNEAAFWASDRGSASQSTYPPTIGTATTDRSQRSRRYVEDDDRTDDLPGNSKVSFGRRNYRQNKELSQRRPDPATIAPHSSGALFSSWRAGRGAEIRAGASHEAADAPKWWREGGSLDPRVHRAGFLGDKEEDDFGSGPGKKWDPYPDMSHDDEDDEQSAGRVLDSRSVYKSARSKRRMLRNKRARAAEGSSRGDRRKPATDLNEGWDRDGTTAGRTSGFS